MPPPSVPGEQDYNEPINAANSSSESVLTVSKSSKSTEGISASINCTLAQETPHNR